MSKIGGLAIGLFCLWLILPISIVSAKEDVKEIIFIPQDDRPISSTQTAEVISTLGYKVDMPPTEILGNRYRAANRDILFQWLEAEAKDDKIAVIASDSLIYGGLVNSRKHNYDSTELESQVEKIEAIHKKFPKMPIYVFSSIMRTPKTANASGTEDADFYKKYVNIISAFTKIDGADTSSLSKPYQVLLRSEDTQNALKNWQKRRLANLNVNKELLRLTKEGTIKYLLIGRDDNDTGSATDQESGKLQQYSESLGLKPHQVKIIAGIDELALLILTHIVNEQSNLSPKVYVEYAVGYGPATVPSYSNEAIDSTITDEIYTVGGKRVFTPQEADLIFLVNTNQSGWTYDANTPVNSRKKRFNSQDFVDKIESYVYANKPVAIGDIAFANGSDNALMDALFRKHLLTKLYGYAGWNTATNSTGFALGMGLLSLHLDEQARKEILVTRYIDDWLYQANVRQEISEYLSLLPGAGNYLEVGMFKIGAAEEYGSRRLTELKYQYLKEFSLPQNLKLNLQWNRIFEANFLKREDKYFPWRG